MSYTHVSATSPSNVGQWEETGRGAVLYDVNEDTQPGQWLSWYYIPDDPGVASDTYYVNNAKVGNKSSGHGQNSDVDDYFDGYGLWFGGDERFNIDIELRTLIGSRNTDDNFFLHLYQHDFETGQWNRLDYRIDGRSAMGIERENAAPGLYAVVVEEVNRVSEAGEEPQLNYNLEIDIA